MKGEKDTDDKVKIRLVCFLQPLECLFLEKEKKRNEERSRAKTSVSLNAITFRTITFVIVSSIIIIKKKYSRIL